MASQKSTIGRSISTVQRHSPALAGRLAEALWFRVPPPAPASVRSATTPPGGEAFETTSGSVTVRGRVYGDWGAPTAYLVHGWGGWWQQLGALVEPLLAEGLCVVAWDAPGHGDTRAGRHGRRSTTVPEMSAALAAVVADFGRPTAVVAHSLGSTAAVHALGLGVEPEALVLVAIPPPFEAIGDSFAGGLGLTPRTRALMERRATRRVGVGLGDLSLLTLAASRPRLPRLLVVHDRNDREAPYAGALEVVRAWNGARLLTTDGLGHRRLLRDPAVTKAVTAFAAEAADRVRRSGR